MKKSKYRAFFSEEIVEKSPYPGVTAPALRYNGDRGSDALTFDWNCVAQPLTVEHPPCAADRDQFILFAGSDLDDLGQLGARVQLRLGAETHRTPHHRAHPGLHTARPDLRPRHLLRSRSSARVDELLHRPPVLQAVERRRLQRPPRHAPRPHARPSTPGRPASGNLSPNRSGPSR